MAYGPMAHRPKPKGPWAQGPFWEGRGLQSTTPISKISDFGTLKRRLANPSDLAETVSSAVARTPPCTRARGKDDRSYKLPQMTRRLSSAGMLYFSFKQLMSGFRFHFTLHVCS